ncbi:hypothetical protein DFJ77DRAFT_514284 [Powellomyces hirtus]|nr:hypothetical protein DFJ77DRAFT_514284 [Powellomyces hirtus]
MSNVDDLIHHSSSSIPVRHSLSKQLKEQEAVQSGVNESAASSASPLPLPPPPPSPPHQPPRRFSNRRTLSPSTPVELDELPQLRPPQLNNVQDVSDTAWFSATDGHPYVRIRLKTKGTLCRADFHDLSPKKQQELIDRLNAKRFAAYDETGSSVSEQEAERLRDLVKYMEKHKRPLHVTVKRAHTDQDSNDGSIQPRKRLASPTAFKAPFAGHHGNFPGVAYHQPPPSHTSHGHSYYPHPTPQPYPQNHQPHSAHQHPAPPPPPHLQEHARSNSIPHQQYHHQPPPPPPLPPPHFPNHHVLRLSPRPPSGAGPGHAPMGNDRTEEEMQHQARYIRDLQETCSHLRTENQHLQSEVLTLRRQLHATANESARYKQQCASLQEQQTGKGSMGTSPAPQSPPQPSSKHTKPSQEAPASPTMTGGAPLPPPHGALLKPSLNELELLLAKHAPPVHEILADSMRKALYAMYHAAPHPGTKNNGRAPDPST